MADEGKKPSQGFDKQDFLNDLDNRPEGKESERTASYAKELGSEHQVTSLNAQGSIREDFQKNADPTYSDQVHAMTQSDQEKAQGSEDGSKTKREEGNPLNYDPPEKVSRELSNNLNREKDDLYKKNENWSRDDAVDQMDNDPEFDKSAENSSDYDNDMR